MEAFLLEYSTVINYKSTQIIVGAAKAITICSVHAKIINNTKKYYFDNIEKIQKIGRNNRN